MDMNITKYKQALNVFCYVYFYGLDFIHILAIRAAFSVHFLVDHRMLIIF